MKCLLCNGQLHELSTERKYKTWACLDGAKIDLKNYHKNQDNNWSGISHYLYKKSDPKTNPFWIENHIFYVEAGEISQTLHVNKDLYLSIQLDGSKTYAEVLAKPGQDVVVFRSVEEIQNYLILQ